MHFFQSFAIAAISAFIGNSLAIPVIVHPGTAKDLIITPENTINGTAITHGVPVVQAINSVQRLQFAFKNNFAGGALNAYVTGIDPNNRVVMLQPDGNYYYPNSNSAVPQPITANVRIPIGGRGSTTSITLPDYISSARVWFAEGTLQFFAFQSGGLQYIVQPSSVNPADPSAGVNWGFVELTNIAGAGLFANISYVDFVGLVLGMVLTTISGGTQSARGLSSDAVTQICSGLRAQASSDGQPWDRLCQYDGSGRALRALSPNLYISANSNAFSNYWTSYVNDVWSHYTSTPLTIDTQAAAGRVNCRTSNNVLQCDGDDKGYSHPSAADIFGCNSGPFANPGPNNNVHKAVVPRLCAAFNRSTLLANGGNVQPSLTASSYYKTNPTNHYSRLVHNYEVDGKGYAFSYDDVNPNGENQSGVVADPNPQLLTITIGGP